MNPGRRFDVDEVQVGGAVASDANEVSWIRVRVDWLPWQLVVGNPVIKKQAMLIAQVGRHVRGDDLVTEVGVQPRGQRVNRHVRPSGDGSDQRR